MVGLVRRYAFSFVGHEDKVGAFVFCRDGPLIFYLEGDTGVFLVEPVI